MNDAEDHFQWEKLATNLRVERELLDALAVLDDLPVVVFKGPILTRMIYGDLRMRASADNDIWVPAPQVFEALERLLQLGYRANPGLDPRAAIRRVGQVALQSPVSEQSSLDLHAEPFSSRFFHVDSAKITANLRTYALHGVEVRTFNEPLAFVHMVAHYVQHHLDEAHLHDLGQAWRKWSADPQIKQRIVELAPFTCTLPALLLATQLATSEDEVAALLGNTGTLIPMWDRVRLSLVGRRMTRGGRNSALVRQFLALFLVGPRHLTARIAGAIFLERDDLVSRYGPGRYEGLLLRHVWTKLIS